MQKRKAENQLACGGLSLREVTRNAVTAIPAEKGWGGRSVEWPRCIEKGRKVRCWLGEQLLFFWGDFSCCTNP